MSEGLHKNEREPLNFCGSLVQRSFSRAAGTDTRMLRLDLCFNDMTFMARGRIVQERKRPESGRLVQWRRD